MKSYVDLFKKYYFVLEISKFFWGHPHQKMTFFVLFCEIHIFLSKHPFFLKLILQMDTLIVYYDQQRQIQMDELHID